MEEQLTEGENALFQKAGHEAAFLFFNKLDDSLYQQYRFDMDHGSGRKALIGRQAVIGFGLCIAGMFDKVRREELCAIPFEPRTSLNLQCILADGTDSFFSQEVLGKLITAVKTFKQHYPAVTFINRLNIAAVDTSAQKVQIVAMPDRQLTKTPKRDQRTGLISEVVEIERDA